MKQRILVIDDDLRLQSLLCQYLNQQGFEAHAVGDGDAMVQTLKHQTYHLLVLDLMLPGIDGLSLLRNLRGQNNLTPVILLTAKGDEIDRIIGLEMGADDYLPKPFNPRELVARIHAVLRRKPNLPAGSPLLEEKIVSFANYNLNLATRELKKQQQSIPLSSHEFALLSVLVNHPRQPLSRDKLMDLSKGREHMPLDRAIDVQISRLRKLIEADPSKPRLIQTVWGFGYVFVPDSTEAS